MTRTRPLLLIVACVVLAGSLSGCDSGGPSAFSETSYVGSTGEAARVVGQEGTAGKKGKSHATPKSFQRPD